MWEILTTDVFDDWFLAQNEGLREDVLAVMQILAEIGPKPGRPYVDTLKGCQFPNLKKLRVQHAHACQSLFRLRSGAPRAIVLCAGNKAGCQQKQFYRTMIRLAEAEYRKHLVHMEG